MPDLEERVAALELRLLELGQFLLKKSERELEHVKAERDILIRKERSVRGRINAFDDILIRIERLEERLDPNFIQDE